MRAQIQQLLQPNQLFWLQFQVGASSFMVVGQQYITILPFIACLMLVQQLNRLGFIVGAVQGLLQAYYSDNLPAAMQNLFFGIACIVQLTKDYVPKNLQGDGWLFLAVYLCYMTLGLLSFGLYLTAHNIPYTTWDLYYLGTQSVGSVLMASGYRSSWAQWGLFCAFGVLHSLQFLPLLLISIYGFINWSVQYRAG